jgi:hypothetical protein
LAIELHLQQQNQKLKEKLMNRVLALQRLTCTSPQNGLGEAFPKEMPFEESFLMSSASGICAPQCSTCLAEAFRA